jgi:hypothetical protein
MDIPSVAGQLAARGVAFAPQIAAAAARHRVDPELLAAVAAQETGGPGSNSGRNVVGDGGHGHGIFQIDDRWHAFARSSAAMDPAANADYAAGMLSGLLGRYGGNVRAALCAYNAGAPSATGAVTTWPDGQSLGYADSVMRHYGQLTGAPAVQTRSEARAELPGLIASLSSLSSAAGSVPLQPPAMPAPALAPGYRAQATDYTQFCDDATSDQ